MSHNAQSPYIMVFDVMFEGGVGMILSPFRSIPRKSTKSFCKPAYPGVNTGAREGTFVEIEKWCQAGCYSFGLHMHPGFNQLGVTPPKIRFHLYSPWMCHFIGIMSNQPAIDEYISVRHRYSKHLAISGGEFHSVHQYLFSLPVPLARAFPVWNTPLWWFLPCRLISVSMDSIWVRTWVHGISVLHWWCIVAFLAGSIKFSEKKYSVNHVDPILTNLLYLWSAKELAGPIY